MLLGFRARSVPHVNTWHAHNMGLLHCSHDLRLSAILSVANPMHLCQTSNVVNCAVLDTTKELLCTTVYTGHETLTSKLATVLFISLVHFINDVIIPMDRPGLSAFGTEFGLKKQMIWLKKQHKIIQLSS